jgi:hypothetical protein
MDVAYIIIWKGSVFSPVFPLLFAWKKLNHYQAVVIAFILVSFISDLICTYLISSPTNYPFLNGYGLAEAMILFYLFSLVLHYDRNRFVILAALYGIYFVVSTLINGVKELNSFARSIECLLMSTLSLILFYQFFTEEEDLFIERNPLFWINIAILTYFSGAFFSFILSREIFSYRIEPWLLHNISNIFKNILLAVGLWSIPRK